MWAELLRPPPSRSAPHQQAIQPSASWMGSGPTFRGGPENPPSAAAGWRHHSAPGACDRRRE
eukprot:8961686-Heterocapsa_arctica.AAC.1